MQASKKVTLIGYILQAITFISIIVLIFTLNQTETTPYIVTFIFINLICNAVMHKIFMKEVKEYSPAIYDKLHTEYPYVNHFKYLNYAFNANEKDKLTKNLLKFQLLFPIIFFGEFIFLDIFSYFN